MIQDEPASEETLKLMKQFGITHEEKSLYFFQGHKYDKLSDAINYARVSSASEPGPDLPSSS